MKQQFEERLTQYKKHIEHYLESYYNSFQEEPQARLFDAIRYSLLAGGKRLRPIFVFEFCRLFGGKWQDASPFAAAIEMIHTYSLIHDDLPCMDNDDYRRGRLTNHKVYGEALAVLAGDALLTDAFTVAAKANLSDPAQLVTALSILSTCAGSLGMIGGQVLDIDSEHRTCTEMEVRDIQIRKTGALIRAACVLGAIAGGASAEQISKVSGFADALGFAFQIRDDMLDVIGNPEELGKATGTDANKNTFVRLYGLEKCEQLIEQYTQIAISMLSEFDGTEFLVYLAHMLSGRKI